MVNANAYLECAGNRLGDNWSDEIPELESWTPIAPPSNIWTDNTIGTQTWQ